MASEERRGTIAVEGEDHLKLGELRAGPYLAVLVDILGQQRANQSLIESARSQPEAGTLLEHLRATFGVVHGVRREFEEWVAAVGQPASGDATKQTETAALRGRFRTIKPQLLSFGDTVVLYAKLADDHVSNVGLLTHVFHGLAAMFLDLLASGHPLRGAICVAFGGCMQQNDLYGPAIYEAHQLESRVALYPRLIVGDGTVSYLDDVLGLKGTELSDDVSRDIAKDLRSMVSRDVDGYWVLDYLGETHRRLVGADRIQVAVAKAWEFVSERARSFQSTRETKLAFRYQSVIAYFRSRASFWPDAVK